MCVRMCAMLVCVTRCVHQKMPLKFTLCCTLLRSFASLQFTNHHPRRYSCHLFFFVSSCKGLIIIISLCGVILSLLIITSHPPFTCLFRSPWIHFKVNYHNRQCPCVDVWMCTLYLLRIARCFSIV